MYAKVELTGLTGGSDVGYRRKSEDQGRLRFSPSFSAGDSGRDGEADGAGAVGGQGPSALGRVSEAPVSVHRQLVMSHIGEKFKKTTLCYS